MAAQSSSRSAKGGAGGGSSAAASSKNAGGGNGGGSRHGGGGTGTTGGGAKASGDVSAMQQQQQQQQQQPKFLLARGYTSRFLPPSGALKALAADEVEKDLRHFQAYHRAVITYRQQYYLAANPNHAAAAAAQASAAASSSSLLMSPSSAAASPAAQQNGAAGLAAQQPYLLHGVGPAVASLPVRIDPEEEKRLALLRRKIARAEWMREDLEQRYVSLRAHYVQCSQEVKRVQQQIAGRQDFLRACVRDRAATLGLMRARLQMTRDVLASLQRRGHVLANANADPSVTSAAAPPAASGAAVVDSNAGSSTNKDPLLLDGLWNQVEEELKKQQRKLGNPRTAKPVPWPCARMPPTPFDVPLMLSNASNAPEKTVAFSGNGVFGSDKKASLVWTLPETVPIDEDGVVDATKAGAGAAAAAVISHRRHELDELGEEVAFLQSELDKERVQNQQIAEQIARARSKNDEWVAMICLVRQETESVLHRHNVVLESDLAREASERWFAQDQDDKRQRLHDSSASAAASATAPASSEPVAPGDPDAAEAALLGVREVEVPMASAGEGGGGGPGDEDNDGDDEGSEEEDQQGRAMNEEEDEDGEVAEDAGGKAEASNSKSNSSSNINKRGANEGEGAEVEDARKKRRKL
jgi:hypothetical protein